MPQRPPNQPDDLDPPATSSPAETPEPAALNRLWTPWRMRYVGGESGEEGCVFCNRLAAADDVASLILARGERTFAILNLFPYNTGHLMLVPNEHLSTPEIADEAILIEIATRTPPLLRALRRALGCQGFNVGFNVGSIAGAGIAEHMHQHVVPRWGGDANFMPLIAGVKVLPELLPATYAKVRAEIEREASAAVPVAAVVLDTRREHVLVTADSGLPSATPQATEPVWRAALRAAGTVPGGLDLAGWAGPTQAVAGGPLALTFIAQSGATEVAPAPGTRWLPVTAMERAMTAPDREIIARALANLGPAGTSAI